MVTDTRAGNGSSSLVKAVLLIAIIGAINWGLIGFFNWNLVDAIFGGDPREMTSVASRVVYAIVGIAGLVGLFSLPKLMASDHHHHHIQSRSVP